MLLSDVCGMCDGWGSVPAWSSRTRVGDGEQSSASVPGLQGTSSAPLGRTAPQPWDQLRELRDQVQCVVLGAVVKMSHPSVMDPPAFLCGADITLILNQILNRITCS